MRLREEQVIARRFLAGEPIWRICQYDGRQDYRGDAHLLDSDEVEDILRRRLKRIALPEGK